MKVIPIAQVGLALAAMTVLTAVQVPPDEGLLARALGWAEGEANALASKVGLSVFTEERGFQVAHQGDWIISDGEKVVAITEDALMWKRYANAPEGAGVAEAPGAPTTAVIANPVLMGSNNPTGWKLEDLLAQLQLEVDAKTAKLVNDHREAAVTVKGNNNAIVALLGQAEQLQRDSISTLDAMAPNQGPLGKPRIGEGSDPAPGTSQQAA